MEKEKKMNKKGLSNFPFGMIGFFILILVLVSLLPYYYGQDISNINLDYNSFESAKIFQQGDDNIVVDVVYKFVDFVLYSSFKVAQGAVEFGKSRPDLVNPVVLLYLIVIALSAPIILVLFKMSIIIFILIKEYFQKRKDKKELKKYKK